MYPLILKAPLKDYIWGGTRLKTEYGFESNASKVAEAWVLSCRDDGMNVVLNGKYKGYKLCDVLHIWKEALGSNSQGTGYFPILIKLIDACSKLSVQVHPNDEYAHKTVGEQGKNELWYVIDCVEGSKILYGFKTKITKEEFAKRIKDNTLDDVVNYVTVNKGDVFYIPAGTLHAIGEGILIAEIQQNSNTTYRVSDYGRLGADGKPRELHIEKAKDVTVTSPPGHPYGNIGVSREVGNAKMRELLMSDEFSSSYITLDGELHLQNADSFISLVVLNGTATLSWNYEQEKLHKGSSVFIPAGISVTVCGKACMLTTTI